jgi:hypothetical protein
MDLGLSFSLPSWAASEGISADAYCTGVALKDITDPRFSIKKGDEVEFMGYDNELGTLLYRCANGIR